MVDGRTCRRVNLAGRNQKSAIEIDLSIWREEIGNRKNRLVNLAGRNRQ
jgi:hypothetical protein